MNVGMIHFMAFPEAMTGQGPILETLRVLCEDPYFQLVEVTQIKDAHVRAQARALAKATGTQIAFGAQPILLGGKLDLNAPDSAQRHKAIEAVKAAIDQAYELDAIGTAVLSGQDPGAKERPAAQDRLVDSLDQLCLYSAHLGNMPLLLETFDRVPFGKNCLVGPTPGAIEVCKRVREKHPRFGLMLDLSHLPLLGETPQQALGPARACLSHIHVGSCVMKHPEHPAYGDAHPMFGIEAGENGAPELAEFLRVLLDIGYIGKGKKNPVSFEIKPFDDQSSADVIANAKATMATAWEMV